MSGGSGGVVGRIRPAVRSAGGAQVQALGGCQLDLFPRELSAARLAGSSRLRGSVAIACGLGTSSASVPACSGPAIAQRAGPAKPA